MLEGALKTLLTVAQGLLDHFSTSGIQPGA
jgi:hypothetical protein